MSKSYLPSLTILEESPTPPVRPKTSNDGQPPGQLPTDHSTKQDGSDPPTKGALPTGGTTDHTGQSEPNSKDAPSHAEDKDIPKAIAKEQEAAKEQSKEESEKPEGQEASSEKKADKIGETGGKKSEEKTLEIPGDETVKSTTSMERQSVIGDLKQAGTSRATPARDMAASRLGGPLGTGRQTSM